MSTPVVSVVLAARNEAASIGDAIGSIREQTFESWELIVVDDGSTDDTRAIVEALGDPRIRVLARDASGLPHSLNAGLRVARAPFVARQDADDLSLPERFERQVALLTARPDVGVVGSAWIEVNGEGVRVRPRARVVTGPVNDVLARFNPITHTTAMFRRELVERLGGYDERLPYAADYELWLRIAAAGATLWNLAEPLAIRHMFGTNMSSRRERRQLVEELVIRCRDLRRSRRRGDLTSQATRIPLRAAMLLAPIPLRRAVRRYQGKAP
jgi:glycosyltransferase involved in cell wall biosynthesis